MIFVHWARVTAEWELLQCTIRGSRSNFFVAPHRLLCYKWTPTLFSTLVSPSCFFSFQTIFFFTPLPSLRVLIVCCTFFFFFFKLSFLLQFFRIFLLQAYLIKASLQSRCNYFTCIPSIFVSFLTPPPPLYYYLPWGGYIVKLNWRCWMWIQAQNGKDVGQNLQSKSHSKNRCYWVTQLPKEGPFLEVCFEACLLEHCVPPSVGSLFTRNDFSPARAVGRWGGAHIHV